MSNITKVQEGFECGNNMSSVLHSRCSSLSDQRKDTTSNFKYELFVFSVNRTYSVLLSTDLATDATAPTDFECAVYKYECIDCLNQCTWFV